MLGAWKWALSGPTTPLVSQDERAWWRAAHNVRSRTEACECSSLHVLDCDDVTCGCSSINQVNMLVRRRRLRLTCIFPGWVFARAACQHKPRWSLVASPWPPVGQFSACQQRGPRRGGLARGAAGGAEVVVWSCSASSAQLVFAMRPREALSTHKAPAATSHLSPRRPPRLSRGPIPHHSSLELATQAVDSHG